MLATLGHNHLVPIVKGAIDLHKGLILRTYHIKPERLKKLLQESLGKDAPYIAKLPHEKGLRRLFRTKDPSSLRNAFSYSSDNWHRIIKRYDVRESVSTHARDKQVLFQNVYGYLITNHDLLLSAVKPNFKKAHKAEFYNIEHKEKDIKNGLLRSKRNREHVVTEQFSQKVNKESPVVDDVLQIQPVTRDFSQKSTNLIPTNSEVPKGLELDHGATISYAVKTNQDFTSSNLGRDISKFINFLNPHPNKIAKLTQECSVLNNTGTPECSNNFSFPLHVYQANPKFWSERLVHDYLESARTDANYNEWSSSLLHALVLRKIDKNRTESLFATYMDDKLFFVLNSLPDLAKILYSYKLDVKDKQSVLASLDKQEIMEAKHIIEMAIDGAFRRGEVDKALAFVSSAYSNMPASYIYSVFNRTQPGFFNIENTVQQLFDVQEGTQRPDLRYFLFQLLGAKLAKLHYIPYGSIDNIRGGVFAPRLINKLFKLYSNKQKEDVVTYLKRTHDTISSEDITVGIRRQNADTPTDGQIFLRMSPFKVFDIISNNDITDYLVIGVVKKKHIVSTNNNKVLIFNPITTVNFSQ